MTFTFKFDLLSAKNLGQKSISSSYCPQTQTHIHPSDQLLSGLPEPPLEFTCKMDDTQNSLFLPQQ